MLKITETALNQIKQGAQGDLQGMFLRIAAAKKDDGTIEYGMGFDDNKADDDASVDFDGFEVVIAASSRDLLMGATIDYVELEDNQMHFIFINPNDPSHSMPENH